MQHSCWEPTFSVAGIFLFLDRGECKQPAQGGEAAQSLAGRRAGRKVLASSETNHRNRRAATHQLTKLATKPKTSTETEREDSRLVGFKEDEGWKSCWATGESSRSDFPSHPWLRHPPTPPTHCGEEEREGEDEGEDRQPELRAPQAARALCLTGKEDEQGGHPQALHRVHPEAACHGREVRE